MTDYIITTARCRLRELNPGDAENFYKLNLHPDVLKFTGDVPFENINAAKEFLSKYYDYSQYGYGRWVVELNSDGTFVGWCGLKFHPEKREVDVGFRLLPEHWGYGYATETANACLNYGFKSGLDRIIARAHRENTRSLKVISKLRMEFEKDFFQDGINWLQFEKMC